MRKSVVITAAAIAALGVAVLALPPMIDWSGTRNQIAARIGAATGRPVTIDGKLSLRLLPAPALTARGLSIGNPAGMPGTLLRVEQVRLKLAVLPLLTGKVRLNALELDQPVATLARAADGTPNWRFDKTAKPSSEPGSPSAAPSAPAAEDDSLPVGAVTIHDGVLNYSGLRLEGVDADIRLGGRSGPFSGKGSARLGGAAINLDAAVERLEAERASPAKLILSLPGDDAVLEIAGLVSRLSSGDALRGRLTAKAADPARTLAKLGLSPALPPGAFSLSGDLNVSGAEASLGPLDAALGDSRASGAVAIAFDGVPQVDVRLTATTLNLDQWQRPTGPTSQPPAPPAPAQAPTADTASTPALQSKAPALPRDIFVSAALGADSVIWHGQDIRQVKLDAVLDGGELMLRQAAARLPGTTDVSAEGVLGADAFDGMVRLKSDNAAALLAWLGAGGGDKLRKLELTAPTRLNWPEIKLNDFRLNVDGMAARGNAALRLGAQPGIALNAAVNGMDVMVKGRVGEGKRIEDGAFKLSSSQGLRPLRAFGVTPPAALERLAPFHAEGNASGTTEVFDVTGLALRAGPNTLRGQVHADLRGAKPALTADLNADTLALDSLTGSDRTGLLLPGGPLMPPTLSQQTQPVLPAGGMVGAGASPFSREPLDLSALNAVDAKLTLKAQTMTAKNWRLDNAVLQAAVQSGTATIERLSGRLLGGDLSATAKLSSGATPALSGQFTIAGADLGAAKLSAASLTVVQGRMDAEARFATSGRSSQDMAAHLGGDGKLLVRNGVLDGFDLPAVNRQMGNLRNLGSVLGVVQAGMSGGRTPFSQLTGTFRADNGTVVSRDLKLEAEGGGATADTTTSLPEWTTRTAIAFHLAAAPQTPIGVRLEGPLENPRKIVDLNAIQQLMVSQGLGRALGGKSEPAPDGQPREKNTGKNILKNLLKGLGGQ